MKFVRPILSLASLPLLQEKSGRGKMVLIVVEAVPAGSKPPAVDDSMRTFMGGRFGLGASAPLFTRASPMHFSGAGGSAIMPNLVELIRP